MKKIFPVISALVILSFYSHAQDENEIKNKLKELDFFIGKWSVYVEARLSAQGPWDTTQAGSVMVKSTGDKIIEEDFTGSRVGKPLFIKTLFAVNNLTGKYQRIFADSEHGALVDFEGEKNANNFLLDKSWIYPNKSTVKLRVVCTIVSPDEFKLESMRMPEGTTSWDVTGRMRYTRVK